MDTHTTTHEHTKGKTFARARSLSPLLVQAARTVYLQTTGTYTQVELHRQLRFILQDYPVKHTECELDAALWLARARGAAIRHGEWTRAAHEGSPHTDTFKRLAHEARQAVAHAMAMADLAMQGQPTRERAEVRP